MPEYGTDSSTLNHAPEPIPEGESLLAIEDTSQHDTPFIMSALLAMDPLLD